MNPGNLLTVDPVLKWESWAEKTIGRSAGDDFAGPLRRRRHDHGPTSDGATADAWLAGRLQGHWAQGRRETEMAALPN